MTKKKSIFSKISDLYNKYFGANKNQRPKKQTPNNHTEPPENKENNNKLTDIEKIKKGNIRKDNIKSNTNNINKIEKTVKREVIYDNGFTFKKCYVTYGITEDSRFYCSFEEKDGPKKPVLLSNDYNKLVNSAVEQSGDKYYLPDDLHNNLKSIGLSSQVSYIIGDYKSISESNSRQHEWKKVENPEINGNLLKARFSQEGKNEVEITFDMMRSDRAMFGICDIKLNNSNKLEKDQLEKNTQEKKPTAFAIKMPMYDEYGKPASDLNMIFGIDDEGKKFVYRNGGEIILDNIKSPNRLVKIKKDNEYYYMPISYEEYEKSYKEMNGIENFNLISEIIRSNSEIQAVNSPDLKKITGEIPQLKAAHQKNGTQNPRGHSGQNTNMNTNTKPQNSGQQIAN